VNYTNTPALTDERRHELDAFIVETRRRLDPASPEDLAKEIAKLAMGCKHGASEPNDRKAFIAIMMEHTLGYPIDIIREAVYEWTHTQTFFPSIAEFCGLCEPKFQRRREAFVSMQRALKASERKRAEAEAEAKRLEGWKDPARRAELERKVKEAKAALTAHRMNTKRHVPLADEERERILQNLERRTEKVRA
jgi:hypothetical protein